MAQSGNKKKKAQNINDNHDVLGVLLVVISAFLLLCISIKPILGIFSEVIFNVLLGTFGIASYPALIFFICLGVFLLRGARASAELKTRVCIALAVVFSLFILQLASTHAFLSLDFPAYVEATYAAKYSVGGVFVGMAAYGLSTLITETACYVVFSLALVADVVIMTSLVARVREFISGRKFADKRHCVEPEAQAPAVASPAQPQRVVDATPRPGLFVDPIRPRSAEISIESGKATDIPTESPRRLSDYRSSPVIDEPHKERDHDAAAVEARIKLYGDKEEIRRREAESFRTPSQQHTDSHEPDERPLDVRFVPDSAMREMSPSERVNVDAAQSAEKPRRVDYENTPGNLNALFFPPDKNIKFNDVGIEVFADAPRPASQPQQSEQPAPRPVPVPEPIIDPSEPERPVFGVFGQSARTAPPRPAPVRLDPIIDASQPLEPTTGYDERITADPVIPPPIAQQQPIAQSPIIDPFEQPLSAEERFSRTYAESNGGYVPPLESDRFRAEEILDASDELSLFGVHGDVSTPQQEEILDGSLPFDLPDDNRADIDEVVPASELDSAILDGSLLISDEPATDLSEKHFDSGDVLTGRDMSGMYLPADRPEQPAPAALPKSAKPKKNGNAPIENQISFAEKLQQQAQESVVVQDGKRYKQYKGYRPPPLDLLKIYEKVDASQDELHANAQILETVVSKFLRVDVKVINIVPGPQVTRYELDVPLGTPVKSIETHAADIQYELAAVSGVRVEAPIQGKRAVGIEVPNRNKAIVGLREIVETREFTSHKSPMLFSVGKDVGGEIVTCDLEKIPHLLTAGTSGSGKSAGLNSLIVSLLYKSSPDDIRFILIDPKRVELSKYSGMPHLLFERVINEAPDALNALKWAKNEMDRRYTVIQQFPECSKLSEYNNLPDVKSGRLGKLPQIVIIIDELANLMQSQVASDIETMISSIAALARAVGIHLIVSTQRPSADVITGTIKTNLASRIAFKVPDLMNSRIIIDVGGAEALAGDGDMLFYPHDAAGPKRVQGSFVSGGEVVSVVNYLKENYECDFDEQAEKYVFAANKSSVSDGGAGGDGNSETDSLTSRIMSHAVKTKQISVSVIQRRFSIGFARAARIIDAMENKGYIGPSTGNSKPREVIMTVEQFREEFGHDPEEN